MYSYVPDITEVVTNTEVVTTKGVVTGGVDVTDVTIPLLPVDTTDVRVPLGETTTEVVDRVDVVVLSAESVTAATNETIAPHIAIYSISQSMRIIMICKDSITFYGDTFIDSVTHL